MLFIIVKHYKLLSERVLYKCIQVIIIITHELCMCVCVCVRCVYTCIHISVCVRTCVTERGGGDDGCVCVCVCGV